MSQQIINIIITYVPSLIAILISISMTSIMKVFKNAIVAKFEESRQDKQIKEIEDQVKIVIQENIELKRTINELLTKIDHIHRED